MDSVFFLRVVITNTASKMTNHAQGSTPISASSLEDCVEEGFAETSLLSKSQSDLYGIESATFLNVPPGEFPEEVIFENYTIGVNIGRGHSIEQSIDGHYSKSFVPAGSIGIFPYQLPTKSRWDSTLDHLYIHLKPDFLIRHSQELFSKDKVELMIATVEDPLIHQLCLAAKKELAHSDGSVSQLYVQSMADALAVHLLKNYSIKPQVSKPHVGGLSPRNLKIVKEYIGDNLEQSVGLDELAQCTGLSRYHFSRAFKTSVGLSPHQYIIKQRVELAKHLLKKGNMPISAIAITCGFTHQSHLTRHFKRSIGCTPKVFAEAESF